MKFFSTNQLLVTRHASVKSECFPTFFIDKNVYFTFISLLVLSHSNYFIGSFIYSLFLHLYRLYHVSPIESFS